MQRGHAGVLSEMGCLAFGCEAVSVFVFCEGLGEDVTGTGAEDGGVLFRKDEEIRLIPSTSLGSPIPKKLDTSRGGSEKGSICC